MHRCDFNLNGFCTNGGRNELSTAGKPQLPTGVGAGGNRFVKLSVMISLFSVTPRQFIARSLLFALKKYRDTMSTKVSHLKSKNTTGCSPSINLYTTK